MAGNTTLYDANIIGILVHKWLDFELCGINSSSSIDGGVGAAGAIGGNNLGLSQSADGASSCAQGGTTSPACATTDGGSGNGGTGAPGGIGGDVFGGTGADGASACETTDSCFNDNGP